MDKEQGSLGRVQEHAFTLTELLVVIATLALLAAIVLPALGATPLGKGKFQSRVARCVSNYRQWAVVANLYANDHAGYLPGIGQPDTGRNPQDVSLAMVPTLTHYGLTVPMWFCAVRSWELDEANQWFYKQGYKRDITSPDDLNTYLSARFGYFAFLYHNWWVPRRLSSGSAPGKLFPWPPALGGASIAIRTTGPNAPTNGWPRTTFDSTVATQPIITDALEGLTTNVAAATPGHPLAQIGESVNINRGYADGHVETVPINSTLWESFGNYYTLY